MIFEEFENIINEIVGEFDSYCGYYDNHDGFYIEDNFIVQKHVSNGARGGNCWGDEAQYFHNETPVQEFLPLEKILTKVAPNISYLKFREIQKLIRTDWEEDREYYGNYTNYDIYKLDIKELYDSIFA